MQQFRELFITRELSRIECIWLLSFGFMSLTSADWVIHWELSWWRDWIMQCQRSFQSAENHCSFGNSECIRGCKSFIAACCVFRVVDDNWEYFANHNQNLIYSFLVQPYMLNKIVMSIIMTRMIRDNKKRFFQLRWHKRRPRWGAGEKGGGGGSGCFCIPCYIFFKSTQKIKFLLIDTFLMSFCATLKAWLCVFLEPITKKSHKISSKIRFLKQIKIQAE